MKLQLGLMAALAGVLLGMSGVTASASVAGHGVAGGAGREAPAGSPLAAQVLAAPVPVLATDNRRHLVYEVMLVNVTPFPVRVDKVDVLSAASHAVVASYAGPAAIRAIMTTVASPHDPVDELPGSAAGMLWLDVSLSRGARIPARLTHQIATTIMTPGGPVGVTMHGAATRVRSQRPVVLNPPLSGRGYADANGCCGHSNHTRAVQTIDGRRFLAQRYAIDWVRIDRRGRDFVGNWRKNKNWLIYGDPIFAAAPGVVVETLNNLPENTPPHPLAHLTLQTAPGNNVIEDIGGGQFALYAHMQTRTVAVHVGEHIRRGQFLGLAGNTGSSTAPHLHFQVMSAPSALMANGEPFIFRRFQLTAEILNLPEFSRDVDPLPAQLGPASPPLIRHDELPLQADVTTFSVKKQH
jgi:Peptidase family M23